MIETTERFTVVPVLEESGSSLSCNSFNSFVGDSVRKQCKTVGFQMLPKQRSRSKQWKQWKRWHRRKQWK